MAELKEKVIALIDKTLSTDVTPLAYLVTAHSMIFGASFLFFANTSSVQSSVLFQIGALVGAQFWGFFALAACIALLLGMYLQNRGMVGGGSFVMFLLWIFAVVAYGLSGFWVHAVLGFLSANYFGYFHLANYLNRLWNYTPDDY